MKHLEQIHNQSAWLTSLISVLLGMLVGAGMMLAAGYDPLLAYGALFQNAIFQPYDLGETIRTITPLILTGLAVGLAFRTGLFNIGVEGQMIIGSLAAAIVGLKFSLPPVLHSAAAVAAAAVAGALWAFIPGLLKAVRGVHEVITTIMMNFIALNLSNWLVRTWLSNGADSTDKIKESASLRWDLLSQWFDNSRIHLGIMIALLAAYGMYVLLWKTTYGFELRAVGYNPHASEYAGMNVKRSILSSMMISGMFAGLAGACQLLGTSGYLSIRGGFEGIGFDGIAVALLGANAPIGILLAAVLFGVLTYGGGNMQFAADVPFEVIRVVFAAIILFVAANLSQSIFSRARGMRREPHA
ncbi:putative ABC transporter permease protein YufP [Marinithermofilum abyssi]|uniref:Putative ABC transporter permease protein YufP n=1 Tax=Marinithermofilum abyssi TaxID=1571185 RepID=A0A8J2VDA7_9BACL|nr:ABC transporter permease [Marinithermofilum abyssi]GGE24967.1 putative ABC transporter permease protein YufP [Marinithermofilum abyssi]